MRALSLWRPWPFAFFRCGKRIENRSWPPPRSILGQWVAMHAAKRFDESAAVAIQLGAYDDWARAARRFAHWTGIVGAMRVAGAYEYGVNSRPFGDFVLGPDTRIWAFGPWCWVVDAVVELDQPIPCKGKQGLWAVPAEHVPAIEAAILSASPPMR